MRTQLLEQLKRTKKANDDLFWEYLKRARKCREAGDWEGHDHWDERGFEALLYERKIDEDIERLLDEAE